MNEDKYLFATVLGLEIDPSQYTGLNLTLMGAGANIRIGPNVGRGDEIIPLGPGIYLRESDRKELNASFDSDMDVNEAIARCMKDITDRLTGRKK